MLPSSEKKFNLRSYARVIAKHKTIVFIIVIFSVTATLIFSLLLTKIYNVSMVIEPPVVGRTFDGYPIFEDTQGSIAGEIANGVFDPEIKKRLGLDPKKETFKMTTVCPSGTSLINVNMEISEKDRDKGIEILNQLYQTLYDRYKDAIEARKKRSYEETKMILPDIEAIRQKIVPPASTMSAAMVRKSKYMIKTVVTLQNKIVTTNSKYVHNVEIIHGPEVSKRPIRPDVKINILFSAITSLCAGIMAAFFIEYWNPKK